MSIFQAVGALAGSIIEGLGATLWFDGKASRRAGAIGEMPRTRDDSPQPLIRGASLGRERKIRRYKSKF
ncbi:hypothetical protein BH11PSE2_BH11PSE2_05160 [soil metagenome]